MSTLVRYWQTRRWLLLAVAFGTGYLTLVLAVFVPTGAALWQQRAQVADQKARLQQARTWTSTEQRTRARLHTLRAMVDRLRSQGTLASSVAALLTPFDATARQAGLKVTALTADTTTAQERRTAWPLHIQASGRYHHVGSFLSRLERGSAVMVIDRLELTAPQMTSAALTLRLDVTRYQFTMPEQER
ncbi:MAG: type 4a pilus biogenesis protein PilO [Candidatus Latescibacteria bacterium]|nr:type 4a pilus biogenesis protein PilO [Candidatus Latescibacterota bacterium]